MNHYIITRIFCYHAIAIDKYNIQYSIDKINCIILNEEEDIINIKREYVSWIDYINSEIPESKELCIPNDFILKYLQFFLLFFYFKPIKCDFLLLKF